MAGRRNPHLRERNVSMNAPDIQPGEIDELLEELHERLLIGWVRNDGKVHTMPSHGSNDGCTDEAKAKLNAHFRKELEELRDGAVDAVTVEDLNKRSIVAHTFPAVPVAAINNLIERYK